MITISNRIFAFTVTAMFCLWPIGGLTQGTLAGSWLVTLQGDPETRTLSITEETTTTDGATLAARFGMTSRGSAPITAKVLRINDRRQLLLVTPSGAQISTLEALDGSFQGTFTKPNGGVVAVTIVRISEEVRQRPASLATSRGVQKAEAEKWLERDRFHVYIPDTGFLYQAYPRGGYTYMMGWADPCGQGKVPTTYSVDEEGRLTLEFNFELSGCPHFKYVFTGTKGQTFGRDANGKWNLRKLVVELRD